jgi:tetratricopeptide (TPR) repeat protein
VKSIVMSLPVAAALLWLPLASGGSDDFPLLWIETGTFAILAVSVGLGWISFSAPRLFWVALGLTLAAALISTIYSKDLDASIPALLQWLWLGGLALLVVSTEPHGRTVIGGCLIGALIMQTVWGFFVWWGGGDPADNQSGTFFAPNQYAGYLLLLAPLLIAPALSVKARREASAWGLMGSLVCLGVLFSGSRGGMVALVLGVIATVFLAARQGGREVLVRGLLFVGVAVGLGLFLTSSLLLSDRSTETSSSPLDSVESKGSASPSTRMRIHWAEGAVRIGDRHPITGSGLGTYGDMLVQVQEPSWFWSRYAHNQYAEAFAEGGVLFALGVVAIPLIAFGTGLERLNLGGASPLSIGAWGGLVGGSAHLVVDHDWSFPAYAAAYIVVVALLVSRDDADASGRPRGRHLNFASIVLLLVSILLIGVLLARERTLHLLSFPVDERAIAFEATRYSPYSAKAYERLAQEHLSFRDPRSAAMAIQKSIRRDQLDPHLRWQAAEIYIQLEDFDRSQDAYRDAITVARNAPRSYVDAATFELSVRKDPLSAATVLDRGIEHLEQRPSQSRLAVPISRLLILRAEAAAAMSDVEQALFFARRATELSPKSITTWQSLIKFACIAGHREETERGITALRDLGVTELEVTELFQGCV